MNCLKSFGLASLAAALLAIPLRAQDKTLLERLDRLEKQNQELKQQLDALPKSGLPVPREIVALPVDNGPRIPDPDATYEVGKQLDVRGRWNNGQLWFETVDQAFRLHVGGMTQIDAVWVHANQSIMAPYANAGIGRFDDGVNFRRARLNVEGTFWEVFDFNCEYDFAGTFRIFPSFSPVPTALGGTQNPGPFTGTIGDRQDIANTPVPTNLWFQWSKIPVIGNVRVGNQKPWISFEHLTGDRWMDFMERSLGYDAFIENGNNGFSPGLSVFNTFIDDRLFAGVGVYKVNYRDPYGFNVGDGEYQIVGRIAGTPVYEECGRCLLHVGLGYSHSASDDRVIRFRARPQLWSGPSVLENTLAIIQAQAHDVDLVVPELAFNYGPFHASAEYHYTQARMDPTQAFQILGNQTGAVLPRPRKRTLVSQGAYVTVGCFLTGEARSYDPKRMAWGRQSVAEPAFAVGTDEGLAFGRGAVELLFRYSWLDLESEGVNGGVLHTGTFGINWHLNPNAKFQINYEVGYRDASEYSAGGVVTPVGLTLRDGLYQGLGTRLAFDF